MPLLAPTGAAERYSMDFMCDTLAGGRVFRTLNIVDDYTRECLATEVDTSLPGARGGRVLERFAAGMRPLHVIVDNGPSSWARRWISGRAEAASTCASPTQAPMRIAYIESFNGKLRDECLSQHWFVSLEEARGVSEQWRVDYNKRRPHRSLEHLTPAEFAAKASSKQLAELSL